ncbi:MAG: right-handed parallel beta-helix repeat-containing protein [Clostridia bacterium]|nr:right-handed parallel beta-helix repeat-containing protein [Clostridia bacterium]
MNIYLKDFLISSANEDMTLSVLSAVTALKDGDTLMLGGKTLHFYPDFAESAEYFVPNNDWSRKPIAFLLKNLNHITIDGEGASLIFHGKMSPFVIDSCTDVTVKNLSIDYSEPMYFEAKITDAGDDFINLEYNEDIFHVDIAENALRFYGDGWENVTKKFLVNEFDPEIKGPALGTPTYFANVSGVEDKTFMAFLHRYLKASKPEKNVLRLQGDFKYRHKVGRYWLCTHNDRKYPGIYVTECKDITLCGILLTHTLSMGVIASLSENITLDNVQALPGEGRMLSVDADATHFVNCSGLLHIKNCRFESMMDDSANIHGIYAPVVKRLSDTSVLLAFGHFQQAGINVFRKGDKIRLCDNESLLPYAEYTVKSSRTISEKHFILETEEPLAPDMKEGNVFENHSRMPKVHIENCRCGFNRPRGFLIATSKETLIENCTFYNMGSAIDMAGDANSWYESGPVSDVTIRNNDFSKAAYCGGPVIIADPQIKKHDAPFHKNIVIEGNTFSENDKRYMSLLSCENVVFRNNKFVKTEDTGLRQLGETGIVLRECKNIVTE